MHGETVSITQSLLLETWGSCFLKISKNKETVGNEHAKLIFYMTKGVEIDNYNSIKLLTSLFKSLLSSLLLLIPELGVEVPGLDRENCL